MKIAFCTPFKPIDHPSVSGDVTIARDLHDTLASLGHDMVALDHFPAKEIAGGQDRLNAAQKAIRRMTEQARSADCLLTYGTYYKVPDIFGPAITEQLSIPYFIYQASYAENRGKNPTTRPGYELNKAAMLRADHIFCNRKNDVRGCAKLLPEDRFTYIKPGLPGGLFERDEDARTRLRGEWQAYDTPVIITAAMMRHGVKAEGLRWVIESCADLIDKGRDFQLVVAGDGPCRTEIETMAVSRLGHRVRFLGMVDRAALSGVFSAGDLFAFPGLEESVGMVYLEAQHCGLPAVATDDEGAPHVIAHDASGLITPVSRTAFTEAMYTLLADSTLRQKLGKNAIRYVRDNHDNRTNLAAMVEHMKRLGKQRKNA